MSQLSSAYKYILLLTTCLFFQLIIKAQLCGQITDSKNHLKLYGASVYIEDLKIGAFSDISGNYQINNIPNGNYLVSVSFIGYSSKTKEVIIKGNTSGNFDLNISSLESPEVIVTGVSSATEKQTDPAPVSIVSLNTSLQETTSNNIIDALKNSPGVSQITEGPAISKPVIRGLGYNRVVVVNDGIRQEGQQFGDEFGIEVDPYTVHKIEILRGPASLSYGSDAMAGVINIISAPTLPEGQIKAKVESVYQTNNGMYGTSANLEGNTKGITFNGRFTHTDAHAYKNKYDRYVFNSGFGENNFKGTVGINRKWGFTRITLSNFNLKLGIVEGGRDEATGQFNRHVKASDGSDSAAIASYEDLKTYSHDMIIHQHVRHFKMVSDNMFALWGGRLSLLLGWQQNYRQEANDATLGNRYNIAFFLNTFNYDLRYIFKEKNHFESSVGINGMQQSSQNLGLLFLVPAYHLFDIGLFAIGKKSFDKLTLSGGIRFDNRRLYGNGLFLDSSGKVAPYSVGSVHRFTAYKSNFSGLSGSLGATYNFSESLYGKINLSRAFRAPNIAESGSNGIHDGTPFYEIGDPLLKPENSIQIDAALGINLKNISAELTVFDNNINNYIFPVKLGSVFGGDSIRTDVTAASSGPTFKFISGNALLTGAELTLNIHPQNAQWFNFNNSFSIVNAVQKHQPDSTKYLPYTPPYKFYSEVKFISKKIGRTFSNAYLRFDVEYYLRQNKIFYKFNNETITPGYALLNIGAGTAILSKGHPLCFIHIYAKNIADIAYQSNMSRLKYGDTNNATGRIGVYEMGRNIGFKISFPISIKN